MTLRDAIKKAFREFGKNIITEQRFVSILADYHAFDDSPALRVILRMLINEGYGALLWKINNKDNATKQTTMMRILHETEKKYGFIPSLTASLLNDLAYALGWSVKIGEARQQNQSGQNHPKDQNTQPKKRQKNWWEKPAPCNRKSQTTSQNYYTPTTQPQYSQNTATNQPPSQPSNTPSNRRIAAYFAAAFILVVAISLLIGYCAENNKYNGKDDSQTKSHPYSSSMTDSIATDSASETIVEEADNSQTFNESSQDEQEKTVEDYDDSRTQRQTTSSSYDYSSTNYDDSYSSYDEDEDENEDEDEEYYIDDEFSEDDEDDEIDLY